MIETRKLFLKRKGAIVERSFVFYVIVLGCGFATLLCLTNGRSRA